MPRLALACLLMLTAACGQDPECRELAADACDGADTVVGFEIAPGNMGSACAWVHETPVRIVKWREVDGRRCEYP